MLKSYRETITFGPRLLPSTEKRSKLDLGLPNPTIYVRNNHAFQDPLGRSIFARRDLHETFATRLIPQGESQSAG